MKYFSNAGFMGIMVNKQKQKNHLQVAHYLLKQAPFAARENWTYGCMLKVEEFSQPSSVVHR
jgi:hypothetical protein